ncbi:hypothetical protein DB29_0P0026 (plasmid) [Shouchella clausii]|nr:hypothetical protein DB29_0P0026 [Shouchella clausii]
MLYPKGVMPYDSFSSTFFDDLFWDSDCCFTVVPPKKIDRP